VSILPHETKVMLELFCFYLHTIGLSGHMTSLEHVICLFEREVCNGLVEYCHHFSAGKLLAASCQRCVNVD